MDLILVMALSRFDYHDIAVHASAGTPFVQDLPGHLAATNQPFWSESYFRHFTQEELADRGYASVKALRKKGRERLASLIQDAESERESVVLLSDPGFMQLDEVCLGIARQDLESQFENVSFVFILRPQIDIASLDYDMALLDGTEARPLDDVLKCPFAADSFERLHLDTHLERLKCAFEQSQINSLVPSMHTSALSLIADQLERPSWAMSQSEPLRNILLNAPARELLRVFNRTGSELEGDGSVLRDRVFKTAMQSDTSSPERPTRSQAQAFMDRFAESNDRAVRMLDYGTDQIAPDLSAFPEKRPDLKVEDAVAFALEVLSAATLSETSHGEPETDTKWANFGFLDHAEAGE